MIYVLLSLQMIGIMVAIMLTAWFLIMLVLWLLGELLDGIISVTEWVIDHVTD